MRLIKGRSFYKEAWYNSYHSMMDRCYREKAKNYSFYGGRGISVCDEWNDIVAFEKWAKESGFQKGLTLNEKMSTEIIAQKTVFGPQRSNRRIIVETHL